MQLNVKQITILVFLLLIAFVSQGLWFIFTSSITNDEIAHIPAGWTYWLYADFRLNPEHPPLIKLWCSIPLLFMNLRFEKNDFWQKAAEWNIGHYFFFDWNKDNRGLLLILPRIMNLLLGVICGLILFLFTRAIAGDKIALITLSLFAFNPEFITHSSLVTTDLGNALFYLLSIYALFRISKVVNYKNVLLLVLALAAGLLTKHSFVMILPLLFGWLVAEIIGDKLKAGSKKNILEQKNKTTLNFSRFTLYLLSSLCAIYVTFWLVYGFKYKSIPGDIDSCTRSWALNRLSGIKGDIINFGRTTKILPEAYIYGLNCILKTAERPTYIWGKIYSQGVWFYFPSTFLLKTPLPLLVLMIIAAYLAIKKYLMDFRERTYPLPKIRHKQKKELPSQKEEPETFSSIPAIVWIPCLYYFLFFIFFVRLNIGNRHILPVYPFAFIIAAIGLFFLLRQRYLKIAALIVFALYFISSLRIAPNYLSYVNLIGGGAENGWKYLADSNYDWGQDLQKLKKWVEKNGNPPINLAYFGSDDPDLLGINYTILPSLNWHFYPKKIEPELLKNIQLKGYFAISTHHLVGMGLDYSSVCNIYEYFKDKKPFARAGYSIRIFREDSATTINLLDSCINTLKEKIEKNPKSGEFYSMLSAILYERGDEPESLIKMFNLAIQKDPRNTQNYMYIATVYLQQGKIDEAKQMYEKALEINPRNPFAWNCLGEIFFLKNNLGEALECFKRAVKIAPESFSLHYNLAGAAIKLKEFELAEKAINEAKLLEPYSEKTDYLFGLFYSAKADYKAAIKFYKLACSKNPSFARGFNALGVALMKEGKNKEALEAFKKAHSLEPNNKVFEKNYLSLRNENQNK